MMVHLSEQKTPALNVCKTDFVFVLSEHARKQKKTIQQHHSFVKYTPLHLKWIKNNGSTCKSFIESAVLIL